ncbi:MAG: response regulator [Prolixibacteraceae bacterium]|jgi:signal transduction histidine kinase/ActR/RegA family two-component response regulator|nr:response regulator [Prolixibacteraceae bacterium]MBT6766133.1 response regulator [Prolixibacteraceae bacterium]MBT7000255.1 response regulator [Prolixibacteraceae bacterium]MBT7394236.1 response regulator [Prolixibacteraceae bacterium]
MKILTADFYKLSGNKNITITEIRRRLLTWMLFMLNLLIIPALIIAAIESFALKDSLSAIIYLIFTLPILLALIFKHKISYLFAVNICVSLGFIVAVFNTWHYGFNGASIPVYITTAVLATMFLGIRAGFIVLFCSLVPMIIVAYLMTNQITSPTSNMLEITKFPYSWLAAISTLLFLGTIVIFGYGVIQNNLLQSIKYVKKQANELQKANQKLKDDIARRLKIQKQLEFAKNKAEESDRLKSAFLANMSHEIRTPMNGILGFVDLLKEPDISGEEQNEFLEIINRSGNRMLNTLNDIIDITRIESEQVEISISDVNLNKQNEYLHTFFKPEAEKKEISFSYKNGVPNHDSIVKTDREKLYSILANLIKNAIKFTDNGIIEFGYKKKEGTFEFYVKDSGIGIPIGREKAIFDRFVQADIEDVKVFQGAGLGLSISKAYVELLGGQIWVESEYDKGSIFYFTIPFNIMFDEKKEAKKMNSDNGKEKPNKKLRILIVEDDDISTNLLKIQIKPFSKETLIAKNGDEAVAILREDENFDLILMDMKMPIMNGYEATRQIRQFNKEVVIIAQTAFGLMGDKEKALGVGCNDYISKPINREKLVSLIQMYIDE